MFLVSFSTTAVWEFRILPRSRYFGALGGLTCSKVFGSIPSAISAASTRNLTSSLSQSLNAVTDSVILLLTIRQVPKLKFQNVFKDTESRSFFACDRNVKEDISTALEVSIYFETK